jgi:hypothetical protein
VAVRNTTWEARIHFSYFLSPVLKVPRQGSLVLLIEVRLREGKALGSEKGIKPEGKRPLERPRRKWECNIRMDLGEI